MEDKEQLLKILYGGFYYEDGDVYVGLRDGGQYTNHSDDDFTSQIIYDPSKDFKKITSVATRDIKAGEEITESYMNYLSNKAEWVTELQIKYNPEGVRIENYVEERNKSS